MITSPSSAGVTTPLLFDGLLMGFNQPGAVVRGNRIVNVSVGVDVHFLTGATISTNRVVNSRTVGMSLLSLSGSSLVQNNLVKGSGQQGVHVFGSLTWAPRS